MPVPQDKHDLQRFKGMVNFIVPHLPNLSQLTAPLRDLLKKTNIWQWDADHQSIFEKTKQLVSTNICLQYYDPTADVQLEVDASIKGLGATLIQNKQPVAFASKSLTPAETNYSNIEGECLAIVHGIQRFHHYLYGRSFTIISDHKPLEVILHKPLHRAPPRIQRMMTKIQGYNYTIKYLPGPQLVISDTLSRLPNPHTRVNVSIDDHVDEITINECTDISIDLLNFSPAKQSELRHSTSAEPVMRTLSDLIHTGWPEKISDIPKEVREFWSYRDELSMQNGIILKGNQVVIPAPLRPNILQQFHASHQDIEKTKKLARESVYWPGMPKSIENTCASCSLCQEMQHQQPSQQLQPHERPLSPWVKVGTDRFSIGNEHYLLISEYYSRYPIVKKLPSLNASATIKDHEKEVVKDIINAKRLYYTRIFNVYRSDMKKTWKTINKTLSKNKQILELPSSFFHNGKVLTNPSEIASKFNKHFANIGKTLASEIASNTTNNSDYTQYLKTPSLKICTFKCVTQEDIVKAIDNLENKNSSGHDGISNKVLKYIKLELSNSLTLIVNQMLTTGIFSGFI